ncbi:thioredoxin family protein [Sulfurovum sp. CS9]|uniref:thioredoxin family protein n=1 Tax=Sulfurovum sp. CS9 TaxID=3391146 RepID=UPI0039E7DD66
MQKLLLSMFLLAGTLFSTTLFAEDTVWLKDINTAFEMAKKEQRTVMVLVEGENCRWCKKMKHRTLGDENVQKKLKSYITVKVMREDEDDVKDLPIIHGVPSIFFMTPEKEVIESVVGYFNVEDFLSYISDVEKKKVKTKSN